MSNVNPNEIVGRVLWDNVLRTHAGLLTFDGTESAYNAVDYLPFTIQTWTNNNDLELAPTGAQYEIGAAAIYIKPAGDDVIIKLHRDNGSSGAAWDLVGSETITAGNTHAFFNTVATIAANEQIRIRITTPVTVIVRQIFVGVPMVFDRGQWQGIMPSRLMTEVKKTLNIATNGNILSQSVIRPTRKDNIAIDYLPLDFIENKWRPFALHAQGRPFFWQYDPVNDPASVTFSVAESTPSPSNQSEGLMQVKMPLIHDASDA